MTEEHWLDGNALAGLMTELFGAELTGVIRGCPSCGTWSAIGSHRLYRGAGVVLRCPGCGAVAMRVATLAGRHLVRLSGTWQLETGAAAEAT